LIPNYPNSQEFEIKSASFSIDSIADYLLILKLYSQGITICVIEPSSQNCLALEHYPFHKADSPTGLIVRLQNIWNKHSFLRASFWRKVILLTSDRQFTITPTEYFSTNAATDLFKLNAAFNSETQELHYHHVEAFGSTCLSSADMNIVNFLKDFYDEELLEIAHSHTALLHALHRYLEGEPALEAEGHLFLQVNGNLATFVHASPNKLHFINSFEADTVANLIYYTLLVIEELGLKPMDTKVLVWGNTAEGFTQKLAQHVAAVQKGEKPKFIGFTFEFDEVPDFDIDIFGSILI